VKKQKIKQKKGKGKGKEKKKGKFGGNLKESKIDKKTLTKKKKKMTKVNSEVERGAKERGGRRRA